MQSNSSPGPHDGAETPHRLWVPDIAAHADHSFLDTKARTDHITILRSSGPRLSKIWRATGEIDGYENAKQFKPQSVAVAGIHDMSALLTKLESQPNACLIRGAFNGADVAAAVAERYGEALKPGFVLRRGECFEDQRLHWLMIDVDHFEPDFHDPVQDPESSAHEFIATHLPKAFQSASFHWSLSASAGHASKDGLLKMHLHFWLAEPRSSAELDAWARSMPSEEIDPSLYSPVQVHYTARPVFEHGVSDPVSVRSGFYQSKVGKDVVPLEIDPSALAIARQRHSTREPMSDPTTRPGLIGAFCRAYKPEDLVRLLPEEFEASRRAGHFNWIGHDGKEGVFITDCGQGLVSVHGTAPTGQSKLCNLYDFVRLHLYKPLDIAAPRGCRPSELPSVRAMRDWIAEKHPHVLKDIWRAASSPDEDFRHLDAEQAQSDANEDGQHSATAYLSQKPKLRVWRPADLRDRPPASWLIKNLLPLRGTASLVGDSNVGKSFCALDAGLAIARGEPWFGKDVKQGAVLYVAAEGGFGFGRRLEGYETYHGVDTNVLPFGVIDDGIDLRTSQVDAGRIVAAAEAFAQATGQSLRLIVLDTMARILSGGDENSSTDMGHVLAMADKISQATGALVLIVHHVGKDHQRGARGHSSFRAALDAQLMVTKMKDRCVIKIDKQRDGPTELELAYRLETVDLGISGDELESETSAVVVQVDHETGLDVQPVKLTKWQTNALDAVLACAGWPEHGRVTRDAVACTAEELLSQPGIKLPITWRKMLDRGLNDLIKGGVLDTEGPYLAKGFMFPARDCTQTLH